MKRRRIAVAGTAAGIAGAAALVDAVFMRVLSREGIRRFNGKGNAGMDRMRAPYGDAPQKGIDFIRSTPRESVTIKASTDGEPLHGYYYHAGQPRRIVLMAHGYAGSIESFCGIAGWLFEQKCDMLMVEQRANGRSGGEWATFGAKEQFDLLDWLSWIHDHNDNGLPVYLYGTSMGGATALMASGHILPGDVAGIIADAAYTSMEEVVFASLRKRVRVFPVRLARRVVAYKCRRKAGFDIADADARRALRKCKTPVLFIHGTADERVPVEHSCRNYQACACDDKELLIIENANHVCSWFEDPDRYTGALADFFEKHDDRVLY